MESASVLKPSLALFRDVDLGLSGNKASGIKFTAAMASGIEVSVAIVSASDSKGEVRDTTAPNPSVGVSVS